MKKTFKDAQIQGIRLGSDVIVTSGIAGSGESNATGGGNPLDDIPGSNTGNNG